MEQLSAEESRRLAEYSEACNLFGKKNQLAALVALAEHPPDVEFTLTELAQALCLPNASSLQGVLTALTQATVIVKVPSGPSDRSRPYVRLDSAIWELAKELRLRA